MTLDECHVKPGQIRVFTSPWSPIFTKNDNAFVIGVYDASDRVQVFVIDSRSKIHNIHAWWLIINSYAIHGT